MLLHRHVHSYRARRLKSRLGATEKLATLPEWMSAELLEWPLGDLFPVCPVGLDMTASCMSSSLPFVCPLLARNRGQPRDAHLVLTWAGRANRATNWPLSENYKPEPRDQAPQLDRRRWTANGKRRPSAKVSGRRRAQKLAFWPARWRSRRAPEVRARAGQFSPCASRLPALRNARPLAERLMASRPLCFID